MILIVTNIAKINNKQIEKEFKKHIKCYKNRLKYIRCSVFRNTLKHSLVIQNLKQF